MHVHFLDPYRPHISPVHQLDARVKLGLAIGFILTAGLLPVGAWPLFILLFSVAVSVEIASGLGVSYVLKRSVIALPFALAALPLVFFPAADTPPDRLLPIAGLSLSLDGIARFASIAIKSWLSMQIAIVLAAATPFPEILGAMRAIKIPRLLVALIGLMWRYLFVLVDEALRLMRARAARSGASDAASHAGGSIAWRAKVAGGMAGSLFLRAFERSDRIYDAMLARGYDGEIRSLPSPPMQRWHWAVLVIGFSLLGALALAGWLLYS